MPHPAPTVVVDDHPDTCQMLVRLLRHMKCDAVCLDSGRAALDYLATRVPELMIVDVMMPDVRGLQLLDIVRERLGDSPPPSSCTRR